MIPFNKIDDALRSLGKDRAWLAATSGRSTGAIRSSLAPNASPQHRSELLQKALSDAIEREEARKLPAAICPPGYSEIFFTDEELNVADQASRLVSAPSLAQFCHDVIQTQARLIVAQSATPGKATGTDGPSS